MPKLSESDYVKIKKNIIKKLYSHNAYQLNIKKLKEIERIIFES